MNIFEGARRIAKLTAALIVVGFVANFFTEYYPPVSVSYLIAGATKPPVRVEQCEVSDASQTKEIATKSGAAVNVNLCFRNSIFKPDGTETARKAGYSDAEIAEYFLSESDGKPLSFNAWAAAGKPISPPPDGYVLEKPANAKLESFMLDAFMNAFQIPKADEGYITRLVWLQKAQSAGVGLLQMLASLAGFWLFVWTVGWIVRGFKGIPQGKDRLE